MPTGYAYCVIKGADFSEYAKDCMRNFGALIHLRDDPTAEIGPRPEETHYRDALAEEKQELADIEAWDEDRIAQEHNAYMEKKKVSYERFKRCVIEENTKLEAMLEKVNNWVPPKGDYDGFKGFLREQLTTSIEPIASPPVIEEDRNVWYANEVNSCKASVERYTARAAKEAERNEDNASEAGWVNALLKNIDNYNEEIKNAEVQG